METAINQREESSIYIACYLREHPPVDIIPPTVVEDNKESKPTKNSETGTDHQTKSTDVGEDTDLPESEPEEKNYKDDLAEDSHSNKIDYEVNKNCKNSKFSK